MTAAALGTKVPLDVVYICLPPFAHSDEVERAAERGVHVFIEKPIALDMQTAERMWRASGRGNGSSAADNAKIQPRQT